MELLQAVTRLMKIISFLQDFLMTLLDEVHVELLLKGNISAEEAKALTDIICKIICKTRLPVDKRPQQQIAHIPGGDCILLRQASFYLGLMHEFCDP